MTSKVDEMFPSYGLTKISHERLDFFHIANTLLALMINIKVLNGGATNLPILNASFPSPMLRNRPSSHPPQRMIQMPSTTKQASHKSDPPSVMYVQTKLYASAARQH